MRKEDYLRALRGFLREIVRQVRNEFNFYSFAWSLMQKRDVTDLQQMEPQHKVCGSIGNCDPFQDLSSFSLCVGEDGSLFG